jgi:hypothetical protein
MGSRWVTSLVKDEPIERGNLTILTGTMLLTCTTSELVEGYKGVEIAQPVLDASVELETDDAGKAGVQIGA